MAARAQRIQLVLDFDGTITTEDTTAFIGDRCLAKARELATPALDQLPKPMSHYSKQYFQEFHEWRTNSSLEARPVPKTIEGLPSFLSESRHVDVDSFRRVRDAVLKILGGIGDFERDEDLRNDLMVDAGRQAIRSGEVTIRQPDALKALIAVVDDWGIVSINWSRRFILGVLTESGLLEQDKMDDMARKIKSNELLSPLPDAESENHLICSAVDKKNALQRLLTEWAKESQHEAPLTVYIGDSHTDIGCLLYATTGLYICKDGNPDSADNLLRRAGVNFLPLKDLPQDRTARGSIATANTIYVIKGFEDIVEWMSATR